MYTQKIANIFDHIQDHSRLGLENKFLENKSRQIFLRSTGLLYKFLPTNLGVFKYSKKEQNLCEVCKNKTTPHGTVYLRCVMDKKNKRPDTPPDLLARFCKVNLSNAKSPAWVFILSSLLGKGMQPTNSTATCKLAATKDFRVL